MKSKKNNILKLKIVPALNKDDGQSEKLEENRQIDKKKSHRSIFEKDVNAPLERGHD